MRAETPLATRMPSNTTAIEPENGLPLLPAGMGHVHMASLPTKRAAVAATVLPPTCAVHVTTPFRMNAWLSERARESFKLNELPAIGIEGDAVTFFTCRRGGRILTSYSKS